KDFRDFVNDVRGNVGSLQEQASKLSGAFTKVVGGANVLIGGLRVAYNGLGAVIAGVVTAATDGSRLLLRAFDFATVGLFNWAKTADQELGHLRESFAETTRGFYEDLGASTAQLVKGWEQIAQTNREGAKRAGEGIADEIADPAQSAEEYLQGLKDALRESGLSAQQLGEDVGGTKKEFEEAAAGIDRMTEALEGNAAASDKASRSSKTQAASTDDLGKSTSRQVQRTKDLSGTTQQLSAEADDASGRMVRLAGSINLGAAAQEKFNAALAKWQGGGTATYIQHFKRSLEGALEVQQRVELAQGRLNTLQNQGVSVTQNFAAANRELRYELMEVRGETERLAEAQEREREEALRAQLALAQAQGDEERVEQIRENIRLTRELEREREREAQNEKRREQDRDPQADKEAAEALERASRGGTIRQEITVRIESGIGRDGRAELSQADLDRLADRIMQRIDIDRART
ncbi:MAG TPA: hypothetical protein VK991_00845, partial [Halomonas sp.]|nr:hypothetical protein [Halomonas sp.]